MRAIIHRTFLAITLVAVAAKAEARWSLDLQTGAFVPTREINFQHDEIAVESDLGNGASFVLGGGYEVSDWVDLTTQFQTATTLDLFDDDVTVFSLTTGARAFVLPAAYRIRPWLGGQLGWYRVDGLFNYDGIFDDEDDNVDKADDSFGLNVGGGFDFALNRRVSLGLDVRYHNAFDALRGFDFVTTMINVGVHFGT